MKKLLLTTVLLAVSTQSFAVQFAFREPMHGVKANAESPAYAPSDGISDDTSDVGDENQNESIPDPVAEENEEEENPWFAFIEENCPGNRIESEYGGGFTCDSGFRGELPTAPYPYEKITSSILFLGDVYDFTNVDAFSNVTYMYTIDMHANPYLKSAYGFRNIKNDLIIDYSYDAARREGFIKVPASTPFCDNFINADLCERGF